MLVPVHCVNINMMQIMFWIINFPKWALKMYFRPNLKPVFGWDQEAILKSLIKLLDSLIYTVTTEPN